MSNQWQNRIVGYVEKRADELVHNPNNPRIHPQRQRDALAGSLDTLGWIAPVIENVQTGFLVDGHERVWQALAQGDNTTIPVIQVDLAPHEEAQALASYDFITLMADYDKDILDSLLREVQTDDARVMASLSELAEVEGIIPPDFQPVSMDEQPRLDQLEPKWITCPCCGEKFDLRDVE